MKEYMNLNGNSGIVSYEISEDYIDIEFNSGGIYRYSEASVGSENLAIMKALAIAGAGLNGFINKNVRYRYATCNRYPTVTETPNGVNVTLTPNNAAAVVSELVRSGRNVTISVGA